jgi:hypothetical protein
MAVDDAYGAKEWREGEGLDEVAYRTEKISRRVCRGVAEFAFIQARKMRAKVFGGPKFTVSPIYEGMLKEEMDRAAENNHDVRYDPQLIDATYALLLTTYGEPLVIPTLNRDGDCISDLVMQMFGSIAGAESLLISLDEEENPKTVMAEAPHGTAPSLEGKNVANPMAMILAGAALLTFFHEEDASRVCSWRDFGPAIRIGTSLRQPRCEPRRHGSRRYSPHLLWLATPVESAHPGPARGTHRGQATDDAKPHGVAAPPRARGFGWPGGGGRVPLGRPARRDRRHPRFLSRRRRSVRGREPARARGRKVWSS